MPKYTTKDIRNVAIIGHAGSGKTTLAEAMLFKAGATNRMGKTDDGTSILDYDPEEKERNATIDASIAHCSWKPAGSKGAPAEIQIVDTPGYPDFIGAAIGGMSAVETAILTISATAGIEVNTRKVWQLAGEQGLGRIVVITKMDGDNIDFDNLLSSIQETLGSQCTPFILPVGLGSNFKGVVNTLELPDDIPAETIGDASSLHKSLIESVIEVDEELLERYLEGEEVSGEEINRTFCRAITEGTIVPILCCSSERDIGVEELLDTIARFVPSPEFGLKRKYTVPDSEEEGIAEPVVDAPFSGQVFKSVIDQHVGKISYFRIYSGRLNGDIVLYNMRTKKTSRIGQISRPFGKEQKPVEEAIPGDIITVSKVEDLSISDTVCTQKNPMQYTEIAFPNPMSSLAVEPKSRADEQRISESLAKLAEEDKTFRAYRDHQTRELVIMGISSLHLNVMLSRLKKRYDVEVTTKQPKIPYRETVTGESEAKYRHKKQTGGRGQFGEVYIRIKPLERGKGFEFEDQIFGGAIPSQFIPAVEKGIREAMEQGVIAGYPVEDVKIELYDGSFHPVDSQEIAFKIAGRRAFQEAFKNAKPVLLEPIVNIEVTIPNKFMGDVTANLITRRGKIQGMDAVGNFQTIRAEIPMAEVAKYATELGSMTGGTGSYTMEFSHYDIVPQRIAEGIIAQAKPVEEEEED